MNTLLVKIIRWLTLLLTWLTCAPLFPYLARKWQLIGKKLRILLLLVSPLMLVAYATAVLFILQEYNNYKEKHYFANNEVIERITGVAFPELTIINYQKGGRSFLGDYIDTLTLEMEYDLSESTYHYLDSLISAGNTNWSRSNDKYNYSIMWGNGLPAPIGENHEDDVTFSLSFKTGSKIITLNYGAW